MSESFEVLVTGSTAIDQTGYYAGSFDDYESQYDIRSLNLSFQLAAMQTSFGGCAPNIAYGLAMLKVAAIPLSSAGRNFRDRYADHLLSSGVNIDYIAIDDDAENSASCLMINDKDGNQVIGFYPGPGVSLRKLPSEIPGIENCRLAILGPEAPDLTLRQARDLAETGVPTLFDPGQVVAEFKADHIHELLALTRRVIVNDSELNVLCTNAQLTEAELVAQLDELVVTRGKSGVDIISASGTVHVDAVPYVEINDVTGCGDAFRAGYACGVVRQLTPAESAELGCVMASINLQCSHTQGYVTDPETVLSLQQAAYGHASQL